MQAKTAAELFQRLVKLEACSAPCSGKARLSTTSRVRCVCRYEAEAAAASAELRILVDSQVKISSSIQTLVSPLHTRPT